MGDIEKVQEQITRLENEKKMLQDSLETCQWKLDVWYDKLKEVEQKERTKEFAL
jgi:predicted nuclease with TOPRIM domain